MAPTLGKRKRRDQVTDAESTLDIPANEESSTLQALFRQHFESTFEPLPDSLARIPLVQGLHNNAPNEELESVWDGFSEPGEELEESVHYSTSVPATANVSKDEFKTFMSTKPPSSTSKIASSAKRTQLSRMDNDESSTDAANLKKDLALQRLLKESHLLDPHSSLSHSGQNRHKALDLRLQDMGSKTSVFVQQKMPLAQRRGIAAKASKTDELRRREAQENGIILEKAVKTKKKSHAMRQRGIGAPSIGKFQGGMLKLNQRDVAEIEGRKKFSRSRK